MSSHRLCYCTIQEVLVGLGTDSDDLMTLYSRSQVLSPNPILLWEWVRHAINLITDSMTVAFQDEISMKYEAKTSFFLLLLNKVYLMKNRILCVVNKII